MAEKIKGLRNIMFLRPQQQKQPTEFALPWIYPSPRSRRSPRWKRDLARGDAIEQGFLWCLAYNLHAVCVQGFYDWLA
jgi:hypothetical protein